MKSRETFADDCAGLPGEELVLKGLSDLRAGRESIESLLVQIGWPRLSELGAPLPETELNADPERTLYRTLGELHGNEAHSKYNSLVRELVSFERALERRISTKR